jgi:hypothetical protein
MSLTVYIRVNMGGTHWKMLKMGRKNAKNQLTRKSQWIFVTYLDDRYLTHG